MKKIGIILALFLSFSANAQSDTLRVLPKNAIYFELGGNGGLYSINYERMLKQEGRAKMALRIGFESVSYLNSEMIFGFPVELLVLNGKKNHFFETGLGLSSFIRSRSSKTDFYFIPTLRLGYRYQSDKNFIFRAGILGSFGFERQSNGTIPFMPWLGFSFGKSF